MHAEKQNKVISSFKVSMPSAKAITDLANYLGMNENTVKGYLNVSNNRCAPKAIATQIAAINLFGGKLVKTQSCEDTLLVRDDDQTIIYELTK